MITLLIAFIVIALVGAIAFLEKSFKLSASTLLLACALACIMLIGLLGACSTAPTAQEPVYVVLDKSPSTKPGYCIYRVGAPGTGQLGGETYSGPCSWYEVGEEVE